jgi:putative acetyltransferase
MHVREVDRGSGVGRAMVAHVLAVARTAGYRRVSLETGTTGDFLAARELYARCGFRASGPFGAYCPSPYNTFMTVELEPGT